MRFHDLRLSTKVSRALSLLAEAKSRDTGRIMTPDEIADKMLRQVIKEKYPVLTPSSGKYIELAVQFATIGAALVAGVTLIIGGCQFSETQKTTRKNLELQRKTLQNDREMKAIELFVKFNEQREELAAKTPTLTEDAAYWRSNALLATTEGVFKLTRGDEGWKLTVLWMLEEQCPFLQSEEFYCETFAGDFLKLMQKTARGLKCKSVPNEANAANGCDD